MPVITLQAHVLTFFYQDKKTKDEAKILNMIKIFVHGQKCKVRSEKSGIAILSIQLFHRYGNWGPEKSFSILRVTRVFNEKLKLCTQVISFLTPSSVTPLHRWTLSLKITVFIFRKVQYLILSPSFMYCVHLFTLHLLFCESLSLKKAYFWGIYTSFTLPRHIYMERLILI